jgi:acyl-CoA thioesterase
MRLSQKRGEGHSYRKVFGGQLISQSESGDGDAVFRRYSPSSTEKNAWFRFLAFSIRVS